MAASRSSRQQPLAAAAQPRYTTDDDTDTDYPSTAHSAQSTPRWSGSRSRSTEPPLSPLYTPLHIQTSSPAASPSMSSLHQRRAVQSLSPHQGKPLSIGALSRRARQLSLSAIVWLLLLLTLATAALLYLYRSAIPSSLLVSLLPYPLPFLAPPLPSLAIITLLTTLQPPPTNLSTTPPHTIHTATLTRHSLIAQLSLTRPGHALLLATSAEVCRVASLWTRLGGGLAGLGCRTVPGECVDGALGGVRVGCVMGMVREWLAGVGAEYVAIVSPDVVLAPHLTATLASLMRSSHATHAHQPGSAPALVLTSHSTDVVLPPQLSNVAHSTQQPAHSAEQLYEALVSAANQAAASQSTALPPRTHIDLFVLPATLLRSIRFPPLLWSGVEAEDAVWRQWLLHHLYTNHHAQVVDATQPDYPLLFHLRPSQPAPTPSTATTALLAYNHRIADSHTSRLTWQLGQVRHAPYAVSGRCPASCHIAASPSAASHLLSLLFHRTSPSNHVMLLVLAGQQGGQGWEDVEVFLCWARRVRFDAWLMAVRDTGTAERLKERGVPVLSFEEDAKQQPSSSKQEADAAGREALFRLWLNELVARMLRYNVNVMLTDSAAIIPLSVSPFSQLQPATNHHLVPSTALTTPAASIPSPSLPGIVVLVNSAASIAHLSAESACLVDAMSRLTRPTSWMSCLKVSEGSVALSSNHYVDLDDYTSRRLAMHGHVPLLIHTATSNTHIKPQLLSHWGLAPPSPDQCAEPQADSLPGRPWVQAEEGADVVLQVRVLTFDRTASLRRLLQSLSEVDWRWTAHATAASAVSTVHIRFVISIDAPTTSPPDLSTTTSPTALAASIASQWCTDTRQRWPALSPFTMSCTAVAQAGHLGLVGQWTEVTGLGADEVLAVLEDDVVVTRVWFRVVMDQLVRFHYQSSDPRLVSLALQHPYTIVGETDSQPYGAIQPATVAVSDCMDARNGTAAGSAGLVRRCYFYYQLIGTWGAVFLPGQYAAFSRWLHVGERNFSHVTGESGAGLPCVPSLLSNAWWQRRHDAVWSVWMIRYMYEHGLYSLYSATTDGARNDSVIVNMREVGENFKSRKGASNTPLLEWTAADADQLYTTLVLPSEVASVEQQDGLDSGESSVVVVYDFHFRRVDTLDINSLRYRADILPANQFNQCWTRADWKKHRSAIPAATAVG